MRAALALSVLSLAAMFACSNTSPQVTDPGVGDPIGNDPGQLPDGGRADAGSDAGTTADAGNPCNTQVLPLGSVTVNDGCVLPGVTTATTATIQPNGCNDVKVFLTDGFNCSGVHGSLELLHRHVQHLALRGAAAWNARLHAAEWPHLHHPDLQRHQLPLR